MVRLACLAKRRAPVPVQHMTVQVVAAAVDGLDLKTGAAALLAPEGFRS